MSLCILLALVLFESMPAATGTISQSPGSGSRGIGFVKTRVRNTGILFPKLSKFRDRRILSNVNRQIDQHTAEFGCEVKDKKSYYRVRSNVDYAANDIFSVYASAQYYCGGPYPTNDSNLSITFDLRTGNKVEFKDLFANYDADKKEILKVIFARQHALSERRAAQGRPNEDDCESNPSIFGLENLEGSEYSFNFSREGLKIQPQWPHALETCAQLVVVPYTRLTRFAAPGGLLARLAAAPRPGAVSR
jgi:hypothetical protein